MTTTTNGTKTEKDPALGRSTDADQAALIEAVNEWRIKEREVAKAKAVVGRAMKRMRKKGAQRQAVAVIAGVSGQTVTHLIEGRVDWRERQKERQKEHNGEGE